MTDKPKVKVIKRGEVRTSSGVQKSETRTKRAAAREMVSTVTNWVSDFQGRKRDEAKVAFEQLFSKQPQPTEL